MISDVVERVQPGPCRAAWAWRGKAMHILCALLCLQPCIKLFDDLYLNLAHPVPLYPHGPTKRLPPPLRAASKASLKHNAFARREQTNKGLDILLI